MSISNDLTLEQALTRADAHIERINKVPPLDSQPLAISDPTAEESEVSE